MWTVARMIACVINGLLARSSLSWVLEQLRVQV